MWAHVVVAGDEEEWMQSWAMENNLSETAFLQQLPSQVGGSQRGRGLALVVVPQEVIVVYTRKRDLTAGGGNATMAPVRCFSSSKEEGSPARFKLRWFTPTVEVDLCGE